jgi:hypothetical protein
LLREARRLIGTSGASSGGRISSGSSYTLSRTLNPVGKPNGRVKEWRLLPIDDPRLMDRRIDLL